VCGGGDTQEGHAPAREHVERLALHALFGRRQLRGHIELVCDTAVKTAAIRPENNTRLVQCDRASVPLAMDTVLRDESPEEVSCGSDLRTW
jgi:hypothetical protein